MTQRVPDAQAPDLDALMAEVQRLRERIATLKDRKQHLEQCLKERDARITTLLAERSAARRAPAGPVDYTRRLLSYKGHARLTKEQLSKVETELAAASLEDVTGLFPHDPLLANFVLNIWEWAHGSTQLTSLPWNISLPISDVCNARCTFCTSWLDGHQQLTLEQLDRFAPVLRTAVHVGLVGHGEPLSHPQLGAIADRLGEYLDPRAASYTITNGAYLAKWLPRLDQLRLSSISCSLNAATAQTHDAVMGLGADAFPRIVETLRMVAAGQATAKPIAVSITLVVTRQNIDEIPAFIELGNAIGATSIFLRTLLPQPDAIQGLNYHDLPPYLHPDFERLRSNAIAAMSGSAVPVHGEPDTWSVPIFPEPVAQRMASSPLVFVSRGDALRDAGTRASRSTAYWGTLRPARGERHADAPGDQLKDASNPLGRRPPFRCRAVYNNLYVNELFLRVAPCCYMTQTPEHDEIRLTDMDGIVEAWNATSLRELRHRLANGPLYGGCERCPAEW
jgi:sulfatase maturation enzyme AslB (radical SAM superfamily)